MWAVFRSAWLGTDVYHKEVDDDVYWLVLISITGLQDKMGHLGDMLWCRCTPGHMSRKVVSVEDESWPTPRNTIWHQTLKLEFCTNVITR